MVEKGKSWVDGAIHVNFSYVYGLGTNSRKGKNGWDKGKKNTISTKTWARSYFFILPGNAFVRRNNKQKSEMHLQFSPVNCSSCNAYLEQLCFLWKSVINTCPLLIHFSLSSIFNFYINAAILLPLPQLLFRRFRFYCASFGSTWCCCCVCMFAEGSFCCGTRLKSKHK